MSRKCNVCDHRRAVAIDNNMAGYMVCEACRAADLAAGTEQAMTVHLVGVQTDGSLHRWVCSCQCDPGNWVMSARSAREGGRRHLAVTDDTELDVLSACGHLHGVASGAIVCDPADTERTYAMLSDRVKNWRWAPDFTAVYDSAVYTLARIALDEYHRSLQLPDRYPART
jgi:hypothetical protein